LYLELAAVEASSETNAYVRPATELSSASVCRSHYGYQPLRYRQSQCHLLDAEHYLLRPHLLKLLVYQHEQPSLCRQLRLMQT